MKLGVSGASGQLGKAVLAELTARGSNHHVVGISRTPESVQPPAQGRHGDYDRAETLVEAYRGLDRLLLSRVPICAPACAPASSLRPSTPRSGRACRTS
ncbi:NAD(P)H-binding protein [Ralstonia solanacearum]|uniref:NAD(P)H-binding protein n=1 Tax=Ralstonia solanacearum TaxID=305 RepID=UPI001F14DF47|nr:NAD(P)H-binding protein [Ralstonia solanacearum]